MLIEFNEDKMVIIPEDVRDALYLENVLNIEAGKLFIRVGKHEGKWAELPCIEISKYVERERPQGGDRYNGNGHHNGGAKHSNGAGPAPGGQRYGAPRIPPGV